MKTNVTAFRGTGTESHAFGYRVWIDGECVFEHEAQFWYKDQARVSGRNKLIEIIRLQN